MTFTVSAPVPLFHVFNLKTSLTFYRDVLRFDVVSSSGTETRGKDDPGWAMLRSGDMTLMLQGAYTSETSPAVPDAARNLWHADTVVYLVCSDLADLCSHLRRSGIRSTQGSPVFPNMDQVFVEDPDGYVLCFHSPSATASHI